ncbi:peptidylprolyl isomerase [Angelakisella massiliensis]|uniref:peptidylprolyl isomerase n=1 Tax=Angelakisella massiliensis TaxID=1871018 RepID=UPI0008F95FC9|nr:peptidylprolyl isomerase [Angelakisella massiliensis]
MKEVILQQFQPAEGEVATLKTNMGDIKLMFFPQEAPKCVENFLTHAKNGYYNGVIFHRVIKDFMIQGGDPEGTGMGGESIWGHGIADEYSLNLYHFRGALCMAKSSMPNSIGSQFYIVQGIDLDADTLQQMKDGGWPEAAVDKYAQVGGYPFLDQKYTVFGQVIEGLDIVEAISNVDTDGRDKPRKPVVIESVVVEQV